MAAPLNVTGQRFGFLVAIQRVGSTSSGGATWRFRCDCGEEATKPLKSVSKPRNPDRDFNPSCGCRRYDHFRKEATARCEDITGQCYGKLTALGPQEGKWLFKCECGQQRLYSYSAVTNGNIKSCGCAQYSSQRVDISGQRFGRLTAVEPTELRAGVQNQKMWKFRCDCGTEILRHHHNVTRGNTSSCGCIFTDAYANHRISNSYFAHIRGHSKRHGRSIPFEVSIEQVQHLFEKQNAKCALTGINLVFESAGKRNGQFNRRERTASLDRIDSSKGYTLDNIQWVHKIVNIMKQDLSDEKFINWCCKVASHAGHQQSVLTDSANHRPNRPTLVSTESEVACAA